MKKIRIFLDLTSDDYALLRQEVSSPDGVVPLLHKIINKGLEELKKSKYLDSKEKGYIS